MKKILIVGAGGLLGKEISENFFNNWIKYMITRTSGKYDLCSDESVDKMFNEISPDLVVNCAAYTDVDGCELNKERAMKENAFLPRLLAEGCLERSTPLVHVSTDYVFNGAKGSPYKEVDDTDPISIYGHSKLCGEKMILEAQHECPTPSPIAIVRTSWLFGLHKHSFIEAILKRAMSSPENISVVDDQIGSPTSCDDLGMAVEILADNGANGVYHFSNRGSCSRYDLAKLVFESVYIMLKDDKFHPDRVVSRKTIDGERPAKRPSNSSLDINKFCREFATPTAWENVVREHLFTLSRGDFLRWD